MFEVSEFWTEEKDPLFIKGYESALRKIAPKMDRRFVRNLLRQTDLSEEKIAEIVSVPLDFVQKVKKELDKKYTPASE